MRLDVVLDQRSEQRLGDTKAYRASREIDVIGILGARRIGLRTLEAAEIFQFFAALVPKQILDGVKHGARMRLYRNAVLRPQYREVQGRHDSGERGGRSLMAADLQSVGTGTDVVGVVNGPRRQPQHFARKRGQ